MAAHDTPLLGDADAGDLDELLKLHVKEAIRSKSQKGGLRRASSYNNLVEQIRRIKEKALGTKDEEQVEYLTSVLDALTTCVSSLHEREHESLLNEVFGISIWQATPDLRAALLRLVTHLVVANSALVPLCLRVLAMGLQPPPSPPTEQQSTASAADSQEWQPSPELVEIQGQVIAALEKVLTLVPTAPSRLVTVIAGGIPHRLRDCDTQCLYLRGALALAEAPAAAAVREGILAAAAEHLLSLDVEIRWQDIAAADADAEDEEEGESEQEEEDIFELEGQTEHLHIGTPRDSAQAPERLRGRGGWEGAAGGANAEASPSGRQPTTESAEKLDALMGLVFEHLGRRCEAGQLLAAWNTTLHTFQRTILHTHRSKFTQYLLWYLCEKDPKHCGASLVQLLLGQLTSPNTAPITRSAAAAYMASFLARAAMVPEDILIGALQKMALWCLAYCQEQDARDARAALAVAPLTTRLDMDAGPPRGIQHQVFYAACQGLLYVLCYRLEQLMEAPAAAAAGTSPANTDAGAGAQVIRQLFTDVMPKLLHHRLAPLAVCLPTVVAEFTRLAQRLNLMDCTALLPGRLEAARAQRPLEMFFPFDPFLLRHSAQHLDLGRTYVHWKAGHPSQAAVNPADGDASDMFSDEEVEGVSETDDEDDDKASSSDEESESSSDSDSSDELEDDSISAERRREPLAPAASNAPLWPHAPIGMRPISAGASRKRPASSTPGSDQGYLHGASFDTNGGMSPLEGSSPGAHPSISPMSWVQSFEGNRLMNRHMQPAVVHTAE